MKHVDEIKSSFERLWSSLDCADTDWTLETFTELATANGYEVHYSNKVDNRREFEKEVATLPSAG